MRARLLTALAAAALLSDSAHARRLLQGGGSTGSTTPGGVPIGANGAAGGFMSQMMMAMNAGTLLEMLVFDKLQSAFLVKARAHDETIDDVVCARACA
jgi:hypothetical protein